jgi:hypothetical protein
VIDCDLVNLLASEEDSVGQLGLVLEDLQVAHAPLFPLFGFGIISET